MARSNGITPRTRTGLIQPVLPALPLVPKTKERHTQPTEEDGKHSVDTLAAKAPAAVSTETGRQAQSDVPVSEEAAVQDTATPISSLADTRSLTEMTVSGPVSVGQGTPPPHKPFNVAESTEVERTASGINHMGIEPAVTAVADEITEHAQPIKVPADEGEIVASPHDDTLLESRRRDAKEVSDHNVVVDLDNAPEPVTGQVEQPASTLHTTKHSISGASIQLTPQYTNATPNFVERIDPNNYQSPQEVAYRRMPETLPNGHASSLGPVVAMKGALFPPAGQPNFPTISDHICSVQYSLDWIDGEIRVYSPHSAKPVLYRYAHSLVLIRSDRLRSFLYPQRAASLPYFVVNLIPARPIDANAFDAALRFLYGDTILSADRLLPPYTGLDKIGRAGAFEYVMSYMVAGLELGLEPVTTRALDLLGRLLDWDIAEMAVKEAMVLRAFSQPDANFHAPRESPFAAKSILQHVFNLIILHIDVTNFKLDTITNSTDLTSRLASFESSRANVNPVLANMVFGSMPASTDLSPTSSSELSPTSTLSPETIASVVMLNIEFDDLCVLADGMKKVHGLNGVRVISEVVEERERRRLHVLNNRAVPNKQRMADSAGWDVIGRREYIVDGNLQQERVGFVLSSRRNDNH